MTKSKRVELSEMIRVMFQQKLMIHPRCLSSAETNAREIVEAKKILAATKEDNVIESIQAIPTSEPLKLSPAGQVLICWILSLCFSIRSFLKSSDGDGVGLCYWVSCGASFGRPVLWCKFIIGKSF